MKIYTKLVFPALFISFGFSDDNYPSVWDSLMNFIQWKPVKQTEKYQLSEYKFDGYPIPAFKIEMILKAKPKSILDVVWDVTNYPKALPSAFITDSGIYKKQDSTQAAWQIIDIPFLAPRLYQFQHIRNRNRIDWYNISVEQIVNKDLIIAPVNMGSWIISTKEGKEYLIYIVLTNPGGQIPAWVVKQAQMRVLPQMLMETEKTALKLKKK